MGHEIYENRFVGVQHAWHFLGNLIEPGQTWEQVMEKAGMARWNIRSIPVSQLRDNLDGKGMHVLVREIESGLEIVGETLVESGYVPISNEELFGPMIELMVGSSLPVDAAGVLGRLGNRTFVTFDAGEVEMPGGEKYHRYLVGLANHTGKDACRILPSGIRVVCANTERAAIESARRLLAIAHSRNAIDRFYADPEAGRAVLGLVHNYDKALIEMAETMQTEPFSRRSWKRVVQLWIDGKEDPNTDRKHTIRRLQQERLEYAWDLEVQRADAMGQDFPSLWTARQAASTYVQHIASGGAAMRANRSVAIATAGTSPMMDELFGIIAQVRPTGMAKRYLVGAKS